MNLASLLQARDTFHTRVPLDSIVVESPLPAIQPLFSFLLNLPTWVQTLGILVLLALGGLALYSLWRHRQGLRHWFGARSGAAKLGLGAIALTAVAAVVGASAWMYNYTEHENAFCSSCHIMNESYMRFAGSEHADLGCHDCHRQSVYASLRQLVLWVAERPDEIPEHSPVPSGICSECHVQWRPDTLWMTEAGWRNVQLTAGHIIHLQSDHEALADIQCVSCHGQQVHRFIPVEATCLSSGCHDGLEIKLGRMATAPQAFHCAGCHEFTAGVGVAAAGDASAAQRAISPEMSQCYGCHDMERVLPHAELAADPHEAACGLCHNPHTHLLAADAAGSCTAAGCHDAVEPLTPFHRGLRAGVLADCTHCHVAHEFRVTGVNCINCHTDLFNEPRGRSTARR
jgi:nitrate/TMAO reductase-like tetraheme cytochrome c subunit